MTSDRVVSLDVRLVPMPTRHDSVFAAFRALDVGHRLSITDDRDAQALFREFQLEAPGNFGWCCLENGPRTWRVVVQKLGRTFHAGDCCGVCCN